MSFADKIKSLAGKKATPLLDQVMEDMEKEEFFNSLTGTGDINSEEGILLDKESEKKVNVYMIKKYGYTAEEEAEINTYGSIRIKMGGQHHVDNPNQATCF